VKEVSALAEVHCRNSLLRTLLEGRIESPRKNKKYDVRLDDG